MWRVQCVRVCGVCSVYVYIATCVQRRAEVCSSSIENARDEHELPTVCLYILRHMHDACLLCWCLVFHSNAECVCVCVHWSAFAVQCAAPVCTSRVSRAHVVVWLYYTFENILYTDMISMLCLETRACAHATATVQYIYIYALYAYSSHTVTHTHHVRSFHRHRRGYHSVLVY